ncbi:hypothetical protein N657DRAFT_162474 [Parathielavia appendiculata]|uniref:Uncharacterized protein n=1 Tax=Parathielavia appendiculata TaxID=2587402 RepID=A0AAN6Z166_9PEZI|nr:hypothetical protein N657DRAFT_162474 [Parathielavia appendiculata]
MKPPKKATRRRNKLWRSVVTLSMPALSASRHDPLELNGSCNQPCRCFPPPAKSLQSDEVLTVDRGDGGLEGGYRRVSSIQTSDADRRKRLGGPHALLGELREQ